VRTHVALLRGINVGGHNKVAMSDLRDVATSLGLADVVTYIQSGNVAFRTDETDSARLAQALAGAIAERLDVRPSVVVLSRDQLARVIEDNPFQEETDHRRLHAIFGRQLTDQDGLSTVAEARRRTGDPGSRDQARVVGSTVYLHTPDGFAGSKLAAELTRPRGRLTRDAVGTARNWATVMRLMGLLGD